jgi:hypothetical protein
MFVCNNAEQRRQFKWGRCLFLPLHIPFFPALEAKMAQVSKQKSDKLNAGASSLKKRARKVGVGVPQVRLLLPIDKLAIVAESCIQPLDQKNSQGKKKE